MARSTAIFDEWRRFAKPYQDQYGFKEGLRRAKGPWHSRHHASHDDTRSNPSGGHTALIVGAALVGGYLLWRNHRKTVAAVAAVAQDTARYPVYPTWGERASV